MTKANDLGSREGCRVEFKDGVPDRVLYGGLEIGRGWGCETSDHESFFTFESGRRGCYILADRSWSDSQRQCRDTEVRMAEGHWRLLQETEVDTDRVIRRQRLLCLEDSILQDFVCRFRFHGRCFETGRIAQLRLLHQNANRWCQFPVAFAMLEGPAGSVEVRTTFWDGAGELSLQTYIRDQPNGEWIIHARLMPSSEDVVWVHWRTRCGTLLDLRGEAAARILRFQPLKSALWYLSERRGGRPQLTAQALAKLPKDSEVAIEAVCLLRQPV